MFYLIFLFIFKKKTSYNFKINNKYKKFLIITIIIVFFIILFLIFKNNKNSELIEKPIIKSENNINQEVKTDQSENDINEVKIIQDEKQNIIKVSVYNKEKSLEENIDFEHDSSNRLTKTIREIFTNNRSKVVTKVINDQNMIIEEITMNNNKYNFQYNDKNELIGIFHNDNQNINYYEAYKHKKKVSYNYQKNIIEFY